MGKQLQVELWQECNSKCKFCYLGKENNYTPDVLKISACEKTLKLISDLSNYPEYDTLAYLGGEFFQGQMKNPQVKEAFMNLMKKTAELLNQGYVNHVWIYATLTIGNQEDLYEVLKLFEGHKGELWILTSYDTIGRFHTPKMEENWSYHMKNIHNMYPDILFNITTILSEDCIDKYLNDEISFQKMIEEYHTTFFFKQCGTANMTVEEMNNHLPHFIPPRDKFLKFLTKFKQQESSEMWDKLFNIKYRADMLYRNANNEEQQMQAQQRFKDGKAEVDLSYHGPEADLAPCGHMATYQAYSDCNGCVICDKNLIEELMG